MNEKCDVFIYRRKWIWTKIRLVADFILHWKYCPKSLYVSSNIMGLRNRQNVGSFFMKLPVKYEYLKWQGSIYLKVKIKINKTTPFKEILVKIYTCFILYAHCVSAMSTAIFWPSFAELVYNYMKCACYFLELKLSVYVVQFMILFWNFTQKGWKFDLKFLVILPKCNIFE